MTDTLQSRPGRVGRIGLAAIGKMEPSLNEVLRDSLQDRLGLEVRLTKLDLPIHEAHDPSRSQYRSTWFVRRLASSLTPALDRILGITMLDLFVPRLDFVFGEAMVGGPAAVVSLARLIPPSSGEPAQGSLLVRRATRESIHELGHTFGLEHCGRPGCVMRFCMSLVEVDRGTDRFCPTCRKRVDAVVQLEVMG
jgi:archaemetzincin